MEKLKEAFERVSSLPEEEKEAFADFILEELEQEKKWDNLFNKSKSQLSAMANEALEEYKKGETKDLDSDSF